MNTKPNLKAIIDNNLDKTGHIPSKGQSTLPKEGWLDSYKHGGPYASSWMLTNSKPAPVSFSRMNHGGDISIPDLDTDKWLMKYQVGGEKLLPKIGSKEAYELEKAKQNRSESTKVVSKIAPLTEKEKAKNKEINKGTHENSKEYWKKQLEERAAKRKDPGTFSKGNYAIEEPLRLFPNSEGGIGQAFDEYLNPAYMIGRMASGLGNAGSKAYNTGDYSDLPGAIAEPLVAGALGLDPLGSAMKVPGRVAQSMESGVLSDVGNYLTTQTPLRNTYKLNPWAFKPQEEMMYRGIGEAGMKDALESGVFRQAGVESGVPKYNEVWYAEGPKGFSRAKDFSNDFIVEIPETSFPKASMDKFRGSPGMQTRGTFKHIPIEEGKILQKDWLRGYKEVPKPASFVTNNQKLTFSQPEIVRGPIPNPYPGSTIDVGKIGPNIVSEKIDQSIAPYIGRVEKEYSPAEKVWRSFFKNEAPPYPGSSMDKKKQGGMIIDPRGQWAHPGQNTRIPGNNITMERVGYPVLAKASNGQQQMMYPGQNYSFPGASYVDEYPMMQRGGKINWLNKYK